MKAWRWEKTGSQSRRRSEVLFGRKLWAFLRDLTPFFLYITQVTEYVNISFPKKRINCHHIAFASCISRKPICTFFSCGSFERV